MTNISHRFTSTSGKIIGVLAFATLCFESTLYAEKVEDLNGLKQTILSLLMAHYNFAMGVSGATLAALTHTYMKAKSRGYSVNRWVKVFGCISALSLISTILMLLWNHQTLINRLINNNYLLDNLFSDSFYLISCLVGILCFVVYYYKSSEA